MVLHWRKRYLGPICTGMPRSYPNIHTHTHTYRYICMGISPDRILPALHREHYNVVGLFWHCSRSLLTLYEVTIYVRGFPDRILYIYRYICTGNPPNAPCMYGESQIVSYMYVGIYVRGIPDRILPTLQHITIYNYITKNIYRYICTGNPRSYPPNSPPHYKGRRRLVGRTVPDSHSVGRRHLWRVLLHSHVGPLPNAPGRFFRCYGTDCQV